MKFFIVLLFCVAAGWAIPTENAIFRPENVLKYYREKVESVSTNLETYNNGAMAEMTEKLTKKIDNKKIEINEAESKTFDDANKKIETATAEGKNVEHCFIEMATSIDKWKTSLFATMNNCQIHRTNILAYVQEKAVIHIATKGTLIAKIDEIFETCKNDDDKIFQACIHKHNLRMTPLVGGFYMYAEFLKQEEKAVILASELNISLCYRKPVNNFYKNLNTATTKLDTCIAHTPISVAD